MFLISWLQSAFMVLICVSLVRFYQPLVLTKRYFVDLINQ